MKKWMVTLLLLAVLLLPARSAYAWNGLREGRVIIGENFTLKSGDTLDGDLVVIGGETVIEKAAKVNGNIVVIGGSLKLDGQAAGDAVVIGGLVSMGADSSVAGDVVTVGGSLQRAEGAEIGGNVITNMPPPTITIPNPANVPNLPAPPTPNFEINVNPLWQIGSIFLQALGLAALAMLLAMFLHPQLDRVAQALVAQPFVSGSIGLLTTIIAPVTLVVLAITVILLPVALVGAIVLALAWVFGMVALGMEVGDRFTKALHQTWAPVLSAGAGTFLLMVVISTVNLVPCVGWMVGVLVGLIGFGAVVMTMFGTRPLLVQAQSASSSDPKPASGEPIPPAS